MDLKIEDPDKLEDTYDLEMSLNKTRAHFEKYDMLDVFTIVKQANDPAAYRFTNLFEAYASLTLKEITDSNEWYATMTEDPHGHFTEDLRLTEQYLVNNSEDDLVMKVNETYMRYQVQEHGGPLFFKIMMDVLQTNSEEAAEYLVTTIKNVKVSNFDGESIPRVVSLIRGAVKRLTNLKTRSGTDALPNDFVDTLIEIFQTSTVAEFNETFAHYSKAEKIKMFQMATYRKPTIEQVLNFAELEYRNLYSTNKWTGINTKADQSTFVAYFLTQLRPDGNPKSRSGYKTICFNCGGPHGVKDCKEQHNETRIQANKKAFWEKVKANKGDGNKKGNDNNSKKKRNGKGPGSKSKFAPPTDAEKKNQNRRTIDGVLMWYDANAKGHKWKKVETGGNLAVIPPAASPPTPAPGAVPPPASA